MEDVMAITITGQDGSEETVELPNALLELLADGEQAPAGTVGDLVVISFAQRIHAAIHHSEDEPSDELKEAETAMMDSFEERFGASFQELTGHHH